MHSIIPCYQGGDVVNGQQPDVVEKPPSPEALQLAYEFIIANILPRMIIGEKEKTARALPPD
jgi:hypothetical protein